MSSDPVIHMETLFKFSKKNDWIVVISFFFLLNISLLTLPQYEFPLICISQNLLYRLLCVLACFVYLRGSVLGVLVHFTYWLLACLACLRTLDVLACLQSRLLTCLFETVYFKYILLIETIKALQLKIGKIFKNNNKRDFF